jgi:iron complex outermembrane receptor protein
MLSSHSEVWLQFGNYNRQQLAIDTGGPIGSSNFLYRLTGIARESDTQTDYVKDNNYQLSPALTWLATDSTTITLLANVQRQESGSSVQFLPREGTLLPAPNGQIPSNRFVSEPDWDRYDADQRALTAIIDTNFNANLAFTTSARYSESTVVYRTMYGWPPVLREDGASIQRLAYASDASSKAFTADSRIHGTFATGPIDHNLIVGVDVQRATVDDDNGFGNGGQFNLYNPTYGYQPEPFDLDDNPANTVTQEGLYIQDSVYFGSGWIFSGAVRFDNTSSETEGSDTQESSATTNRLALMHIFDGGLSTYASYGESFDPVLGFDAYGDTFEPKRGKQVEYGIKYQPTGTKHLVTLSYFDIVEKNRTTPLPISSMSDPDVEDPSGMVQTGEVEINGIEFETQLEFDLLEVYASYSTNESEITKSNTLGEEGAELSATPQEMYSLWLSYWPQILGRKFRIGSGYRFIGRTSDGSAEITAPDGTVEHAPRYTPSYDMIDFMIGYQFGKFDVSFNVANVEDETVISACLARGDCFYAQRRTITSNLKYTF